MPEETLQVRSPTVGDRALVAMVASAELMSRGVRHRGYWRFCTTLSRMFGDSNRELTVAAGDFAFRFPLKEGYWLRLLGSGFAYEPELAFVLRSMARQRYLFLDCGANLGYWSARVCSAAYGSQRAIAVEADARNYHRLEENARLNGDRFTTLLRALWERSGVQMELFGDADFPTDFSLAANASGKQTRGTVETICLDDIVLGEADRELPKIIKLDVEGVEAAALRGAQRVLDSDCLVLYEDHGADRSHASTKWFLEQGGYAIWSMDEGGIATLNGVADLDRLKTNVGKGYNFAATRTTSNWRERLETVDRSSPRYAATGADRATPAKDVP